MVGGATPRDFWIPHTLLCKVLCMRDRDCTQEGPVGKARSTLSEQIYDLDPQEGTFEDTCVSKVIAMCMDVGTPVWS